jgi:putative ABC transport system permease protein
MIRLWCKGLLVGRSGRLLGAMAGVALTVALLAAIGAFIISASASMTERAIAGVPVDWQIQLVPGTDPQAVQQALAKATRSTALQRVGYADAAGFTARTGNTVQTTGPGKVLGLGRDYRTTFPGQIRLLIGSLEGVLAAQQTAANLHVTVGDTVTVERVGLPSVDVPIAGVVDLPNADSMFQAVGVPAGAAPQAPPDNLLLMPMAEWHSLFDPQAKVRTDSVRMQLHVNLAHDWLPPDPSAAYVRVQEAARNLEARIAGSGIVADNLAARLGGVREDALYARVLFLFLGIPGAILAALLTVAVAAAGRDRRRREQAVLRARGASSAQILQLAGVEALVVGLAGVLPGILLAGVASVALLGAGLLSGASVLWLAGTALSGMLLAAGAILVPAWSEARRSTVVASRAIVGHTDTPLWRRFHLDLIFLAIAAAVFGRTASSGYQVVLAPEGVASTAVDYQAFVAPLFLWIGMGLLTLRLWNTGLERGRNTLGEMLRPLAHELSRIVAASLSRERWRVTRGVVFVALAFSFATSTAVFNTTYNAQSRVDAELTNGADVTVTGTTAAPAGSRLTELRALPGVAAAQPMQHRFAYVGTDLQDLYGIDPAHIGSATRMSDAYFESGDAQATLAALGSRQDGVLVSAETVRDFQLQVGDQINLRLQNAADHQYHTISFHFVGVVREFPTAPKDSFLVANAGYVGKQTETGAAEVVLLRTSGNPADVAGRARTVVASLPGATVTDIGGTARIISSSLTAVDLHGLTRLELGFAVLMVAGAAGLVQALGLAERRRTFAILSALGAKDRQLGAFLWSEGALVLVSGVLVGLLTGFGLAEMLVKALTGVFDPPPQFLSVPWLYLIGLIAAATISAGLAVIGAQRAAHEPVVEALRDL